MKNFILFILLLTFITVRAQEEAISFEYGVPEKIELNSELNVPISVDMYSVKRYRYKLKTPTNNWEGNNYAINNWSSWHNNFSFNIRYDRLTETGRYALIIEYENYSGQTFQIRKTFRVINNGSNTNNTAERSNGFSSGGITRESDDGIHYQRVLVHQNYDMVVFHFLDNNLFLGGISGIDGDSYMFARCYSNSDALLNTNVREAEYETVLRDIAFQFEFSAENLLEKYGEAASGMTLSDAMNVISPLLSVTDKGESIIKAISQISNLRFVKNVNDYTRALNKLKNLGRKIRHSNLDKAIAGISLVIDVVDFSQRAMQVYNTSILLNAAAYDIALMRIEYLEKLNLLDDFAYKAALKKVKNDILNIPGDYWSSLAKSMEIHKKDIIEGTFDIVDGITTTASLMGVSSYIPYIGVALFGAKTIIDAQLWQSTLRQTALSATIYWALSQKNISDRQLAEIKEYSEYLFYSRTNEMLNIGWLKFWEIFRRAQQETRENFENKLTEVSKKITNRRIEEFVNGFESSKKNCLITSVPITYKNTFWGDCYGNKCVEIEIEYDSLYSNCLDIDFINQFAYKGVLSYIKFHSENFPQLIDSIALKFINEYKSAREGSPENKISMKLIEKFKYVEFSYPFISMMLNRYTFEWGAHGNTRIIFYNFDVRTQKLLKYDSFFDTNEKRELTFLAKEFLKRKYNLKPYQSLEDAGLMIPKKGFSVNGNFIILKEGVKFLFNEYEIASYSEGQIEVLIPKKAMSAKLRRKLYND